MAAFARLGAAATAVADDVASFARLLGLRGKDPRDALAPGLRTYRVERHGGLTRLHLRVDPDGTGMLFVDVTDAVHLSETAVVMAHLALEGMRESEAIARLLRRYRGVSRGELRAHYRKLRQVIETLSDPRAGCRSCLVDLPRQPLFSTRAKAPYKVDVALTYACNNKCPHCYNDPERFDLASLATADWKRVIDALAEVGVPHLIFTGGEATLHPGLPELIAHADGYGQIVGLNTNGRRITHRPYMQELRDAGLDHVQVTLESHRADIHDAMVGARAFHQTVKGVETALEAGVHVITNTTLTKVSAPEAEETVRFLHRLGLTTFAMNGMIYSGGGSATPDAIPQDELPALLVRVRDTAEELGMRFLWYTVTEYCEMSPVELEIGAKRCNAGEYSMCVEPNGDVLPCQSYYVSAGNLLRDPWEQIWKGELFRSFRDREDDPSWAGLPEKCWECPDLPLCGGGCRIERELRDDPGGAAAGCQSCASGGLRSSGRSAADTAQGCSASAAPTGCASGACGCGDRGKLIQISSPIGKGGSPC
jgi:radical SAM protein with 4Fe4S-binding SPASM domain